MAIQQISKINLKIFREFTWPKGLPDFGQYNLIYGWNGSGKTTLSNLLRSLETRGNVEDGQATVRIDGKNIPSSQFDQARVPIRVFNRHFIAENVFTTDHSVTPIYVLGKKNVENQKRLDELKVTIEGAQEVVQECRGTSARSEAALDNFCIAQARAIKNSLGREGNPYSTYDKRNFQQTARELVKADGSSEGILDGTTRDRLQQQHTATPKEKVHQIKYEFPDLEGLSQKVAELLSATVISSVIKTLSSDPDLAAWTREGLKIHRDRNAAVCLFCAQELPPGRVSELEGHFNDEYERLHGMIDDELVAIGALKKSADHLQQPSKAELYDHFVDDYESSLGAFLSEVDSVKGALSMLEQALENKKAKSFEAQHLHVSVSQVDTKSLGRVNTVIDEHNGHCDQFRQHADEAREKLERHFVASVLDEYRCLVNAFEEAKAKFQSKNEESNRFEQERTRITRQMEEHLQPAVDLTQDLYRYLGHDELRLEAKDTGYQITRHGKFADDLSEGETTAVALLYFLKSLTARGFDLSKAVVVLDDPVSSLDANAIFSAFGYIRERTQNAGQLIVLTHNFTFFRQVRHWFKYPIRRGKAKKRPAKQGRFYMLEWTTKGHERCASLRRLDPLLEKYESEYHYLFARIYRAAKEPGDGGLEAYYVLPNMARRVLESFLAFRRPGPEKRGTLRARLDAVDLDEHQKQRIIRFFHTQSHRDQVGEPEHDLSALSEARAALNDLLELMKNEDPKHFSGMVSLALHSQESQE